MFMRGDFKKVLFEKDLISIMLQYIFVILGFLIGIRGIVNLRSWKSNNDSEFVSNPSGVKIFFEILWALHTDILKCKLIFNKIRNFGI